MIISLVANNYSKGSTKIALWVIVKEGNVEKIISSLDICTYKVNIVNEPYEKWFSPYYYFM